MILRIYPLFQISSFMHFKAGKNPAYDYFFFFESLISFFVGGLRNFDKPNEIVEIEVGNPIFFHSFADTFLNAIVISFL